MGRVVVLYWFRKQKKVPVRSGPSYVRASAAVLAAVESAAVSAVAWSCRCVVGFGWLRGSSV